MRGHVGLNQRFLKLIIKSGAQFYQALPAVSQAARAYREQAGLCKSAQPLSSALGISIMEAQLSDQQRIAFDAIHHAMFVCYAT